MKFDYKRMIKHEINVGTKEKNIRLIAGSVAIVISLPVASITLLLIGLVLIATGYSGWCPVYSGMERNTCESEQKK
jgi:hypothetical protein